jgi:hypothetical protein
LYSANENTDHYSSDEDRKSSDSSHAKVDKVGGRAGECVFFCSRKSGQVDGHKAVVGANVPQLDALVVVVAAPVKRDL